LKFDPFAPWEGYVMTELDKWDSFYVIVGSSGGALIGLQFVVMTLIADRPPRWVAEAGKAFSTPTVIHFGAVLFLSAALRAPWDTTAPVAWLCVFAGLAGVGYILLTGWRIFVLKAYRAEFEDWLFHVFLPLLGYGVIAGAGFAASTHLREALFAVAGALLLLLFSGIHNTWDAVSYQVYVLRLKQLDGDES
jgi:hypothetical protein